MNGMFRKLKNPAPNSKRMFVMVLTAIFVLGIAIIGALASDGSESANIKEFQVDGLDYFVISEEDRTAAVGLCDTDNAVINIPAEVTYDGITYTVVEVDGYSFYGKSRLTTVTFPDTITTIGSYAFSKCSSLTSVTIPASVETIGECAFRDCTKLPSINVSEHNKNYSSVDGVLYNKEKDTLIQFPCGKGGTFTTPDFINTIDWYAFSGNNNLTSVTLTSNVKTLVDHAFYQCWGLTSVTFSDGGIESIEWSTFEDCSKLKTLNLSSSITYIGGYAFRGCNEMVSVTIPAQITGMGVSAFAGCAKLEEINVDPNNQEFASIDGVLYNYSKTELLQYPCGKAGGFVVPDSVVVISLGAFADARLLDSVVFGSGTQFLQEYAFYGCVKLKSVVVPSGETTLQRSVFEGCIELVSVTLHDGLRFINNYAFYGCLKLASIEIPDTVVIIGACAFMECESLTSIHMSDNVGFLGPQAFRDCKSLVSVRLSNNIETIEDEAFYRCSSLTEINLPTNLMYLMDSVFGECVSITEITIPGNLIELGGFAFYGCEKLTSVIFENGVENIMDFSFMDCTSLQSVIIPESASVVSDSAFTGCTSLTKIEVDRNNQYYASKDGILFSEDMTTLVIYPSGKPGHYTIPTDVNHLSDYSFVKCIGLTSIEMRSSSIVESWKIFDECHNLQKIIITDPMDKLVTVDGVVFSKDMKKVVLCPEGKTGTLVLDPRICEIGMHAFYNTSLTSIVISGGTSIELETLAFSQCNPNLKFESGIDGYNLELFHDEKKTKPFTIEDLSTAGEDTIYLKWTEVPSPPEPPASDDTDGLAIGIVLGAIAIAILAAFILIRRRM